MAGARATASASAHPVLETVPVLCEELLRVTSKRAVLSSSRVALKLWSAALESSHKREELVKSGGIAALVAALDCGTTTTAAATTGAAEARHAALGALAALLAADDRWVLELVGGPPALLSRVLAATADALARGSHDRSRAEAARLLAPLARVPEVAPRIWGACGDALVASLLGRGNAPDAASTAAPAGGTLGGPSSAVGASEGSSSHPATAAGTPPWAGRRQLQLAAAAAVGSLIEPTEWEPEAVRTARRLHVLQQPGALAALVDLAAGGGGSSSVPRELALAAAACLRFVALAPEAAQAVADDGSVSAALVAALLKQLDPLGPGASDAATQQQLPVAAYLSGTIWELSSFPAAAERLCGAGAVEVLVHTVERFGPGITGGRPKGGRAKKPASAGTGAKGQKEKQQRPEGGRKAGGSSGPRPLLPARPADPGGAAATALVNAAGALHHLTLLDEAKERLVAAGGAAPLAALLRGCGKAAPGAWDHALGALWNTGRLEGARGALAAAGAPAFVTSVATP